MNDALNTAIDLLDWLIWCDGHGLDVDAASWDLAVALYQVAGGAA